MHQEEAFAAEDGIEGKLEAGEDGEQAQVTGRRSKSGRAEAQEKLPYSSDTERSAGGVTASASVEDDPALRVISGGHKIDKERKLLLSSLLIGEATHTDSEMLSTARENLPNSKLGVHVIPGIATVEKDIKPAIDLGVDVFRIASHVTEATVTKSHIEFLSKSNKEVIGVLMMSALATVDELMTNAKIMEDYGAQAVVIMDSTGTYLPDDVKSRIFRLKDGLNVPIGFHAHNNLNYAIHNSIVAVKLGATYIDACIRGFGAGAGPG